MVVELTDYADSTFGYPTSTVGLPTNFVYYHPKPIPRDLTLPAPVISELVHAEAKLGELSGVIHHIPNLELFSYPFTYKEAIASTHIEGTQTTLEEFLQTNLKHKEVHLSIDNQEVHNYIDALRSGIDLLDTIPLSGRFLRELHKILLRSGSGVRGEEKTPGQFRTSPVWIGSPGHVLATAKLVPPIPDLIGELIADWEHYVNDETIGMPLLKAAMAHYQFETIHPFLDGNGRIGRLLIGFILHHEGRLPYPMLYLSGFFDTYRDEYYAHLAGVQKTGDISSYLQFFFTAIRLQATDAISRAEQLLELREKYQRQSSADRSRIAAIIPILFENPVLSAQYIQRKITQSGDTITIQGVHRLLERAVEYGWIERQNTYGASGSITYHATEILAVLNAEPEYL